MNLLSYKGYLGSVEFDQDERVFYGRLAFIRALVSYEAKDAEGLVRAFHEAVDDYLAYCAEEGEPPERPLKGSFNVRTGPDLHRRAVVAAARAGMSLKRLRYACAGSGGCRGDRGAAVQVRAPPLVGR